MSILLRLFALVALLLIVFLSASIWFLQTNTPPQPNLFSTPNSTPEKLRTDHHPRLSHCPMSVYARPVTYKACSVVLVGDAEYGAWYLCELPKSIVRSKQQKPVVYSFGIGENTSFDEAMIRHYDALVFGFDPTPRARKYVDSRASSYQGAFTLYEYGLGQKDGIVTFYAPQNPEHVSLNQKPRQGAQTIEMPLRTLYSAMSSLGHCNLDVLKVDIEGEEFAVLQNILLDPVPLVFTQILLEFHPSLAGPAGHSLMKQITVLFEIRGFSVSKATPSNEISFYRSSSDKMLEVASYDNT